MSLSYSKNYYIKKLLIQFFSLLLLTFISSCNWNDLNFSKYFLEINREKRDSYSYNDYENFSRELKGLYEWRRSLKIDKGREIVKGYNGWGNLYKWLSQDKNIYKAKSDRDESSIRGVLEGEYNWIKHHKEILENLNKNDNIRDDKLKYTSSFYWFYYYIYWIILYKNTIGSAKLKEMYPDFDILFVKESLARVTKILIYHFPSLYNDLSYLFEDTDKYFK